MDHNQCSSASGEICERSFTQARKTLEPRLLMPLSSNLMSEVIQALRNRTHLMTDAD